MTTLENFVSPALTRALGWTLLHSLWQGALVAAVLAGALLLLRRQRAEVRYVASAGALGMVVALAGITFGLYLNAGTGKKELLSPTTVKAGWVKPLERTEMRAVLATSTSLGAEAGVARQTNKPQVCATGAAPTAPTASEALPARPNWLTTGLRYFDRNLPLLVVAWLLGLLAMSLRMLGGLLYVQRLKRYRVRPLGEVWQNRLAALAERSGVRRPVALLESALVQVPLVVGHLRPVILLPLGAVAGIAPSYLEAILAHELAHVLRRDYLVNLLQTVAEVLFFYHPAVWFVANCVRTERENCCDDTATALCGGDSLRLARALTALAEWSQSAVVPASPRLALAAIGGRGALLSRVRRLVQRRPAAPTLAEGIMAGALVLGGLGLLGSSVALAGPLAQPNTPASKPAAFDWQTGPAQATPKPTGATDTTKRAAVSTAPAPAMSLMDTPPPMPPAADAPLMAGNERREMNISEDAPGPQELAQQHDTIVVRSRARRSRPARARENRRVIIDGREVLAPGFSGNPGTVVVTKDKKGRLTDLVVNGQRVETGTGKDKLKIKGKKDGKDQQVEVIRVVPSISPDVRTYVYRGNGSADRVFERDVQRNFEFRAPEFERQFGEQFNRDFNPNPNFNNLNDLNGRFRVLVPGAALAPASSARAQDALRTAERALREASTVKNLSAEQRKRISSRLDEVRAQLKASERSATAPRVLRLNGDYQQLEQLEQLRSRQEEMRGRQEEMQDRQEELRERRQEIQQRRQELQERIRESQQELRELDRARSERSRQGEDALVAELLKDKLIKDRNNFQFKLTARSLVVEGKEQPKKVFQKYLKLYESSTGRKMTATSSMMMGRNGSIDFDGDVQAPRPPRPPRAPRAPRALMPAQPEVPAAPFAPGTPATAPTPPTPPAMEAPAAPRPPKAPSVDSQALRSELRKDGLIGPDAKGFQLQLNASGLTVNGKRQSDELAAKYRKLVGHDDGKAHNLSISTQE